MWSRSVWQSWPPARGVLVLSGVALVSGIAVLLGWVDWPALGRWARPSAVPVALFAVTFTGLAVARRARRRGERAPRTRAAAMSWWLVVVAAIVVAAVGWVATSWLLGEADRAGDADKRALARVEAIKTGLGVGAGTTGIFALLLAVRRQQHTESDATEKNVTDLYTKAADQLGSAEAPVRLAGLYSLERLAHSNPGQRQSIVNVICAYLRMPFALPGTESTRASLADQFQEHQGRVQEREVRLAAQDILVEHLQPRLHRKFWENIELNLANAHLIDFKLAHCRVRTGSFVAATFTGGAEFAHTTFTDRVGFVGATFTGDARFDNATFGPAEFAQATFSGDAGFSHATFTGDAEFESATFAGGVRFIAAAFTRRARFSHANFGGDAEFGGTTFNWGATLADATFVGEANFGNAKFAGDVSFHNTNFTGSVTFISATFTGDVKFRGTTFVGDAVFGNTTFAYSPWFFSATFTGDVWFDGATFTRGARFGDTSFTGDIRFVSAIFAGDANFADVTITGAAKFDAATFTGNSGLVSANVIGGVRFARATFVADAVFMGAAFKADSLPTSVVTVPADVDTLTGNVPDNVLPPGT